VRQQYSECRLSGREPTWVTAQSLGKDIEIPYPAETQGDPTQFPAQRGGTGAEPWREETQGKAHPPGRDAQVMEAFGLTVFDRPGAIRVHFPPLSSDDPAREIRYQVAAAQ